MKLSARPETGIRRSRKWDTSAAGSRLAVLRGLPHHSASATPLGSPDAAIPRYQWNRVHHARGCDELVRGIAGEVQPRAHLRALPRDRPDVKHDVPMARSYNWPE